MNVKTTILLVVALAALVAAVLLTEETGTEPTRDELWFPGFSAGDVTEIRWSVTGNETKVRRIEVEGEDTWVVEVAGVEVPATSTELEELMNELGRSRVRKRLPADEVDAQSRKEYGLEVPPISFRFKMRDEDHRGFIGEPGVGGETVYAQGEPGGDVLLVGKTLLDVIGGLGPASLRARRILDPGAWSVYRVQRVTVFAGVEKRLVAARRGDDSTIWAAEVPFRGDLDPVAMESGILADVLGIEAREFTVDGVKDEDLARYGLDAPRFKVVLEREEGVTRTILFGGPVPEKPDGFYFMEEGRAFVYEGADVNGVLSQLAADPADLRDRHVTRFGYAPLGQVDVEAGDRSFTLVHDHSKWHLTEPEKKDLDANAVDLWFDALRGLRAEGFLDDADLEKLGFDEPSAVITFWKPLPDAGHDHGKEKEEGEERTLLHGDRFSRLRVFAGTGEHPGTWLQREGAEQTLYRMGPVFEELLAVGHFRLLPLGVFAGESAARKVSKIVTRRGEEETVIAQVDGKWPADTDTALVTKVPAALMGIVAERWVGPAAGKEAEYGLDAPEMSMTVDFVSGEGAEEKTESLGVVVGKETEDGRFARVTRGGEAESGVFVLPNSSVESLFE